MAMYSPVRPRESVVDAETQRRMHHGDSIDFEDVATSDTALQYYRSKSSIERIEAVAGAYSQKALELLIKRDERHIDRDVLKKAVAQHRERVIGCLTLPFSLAFFLLFAVAALLHQDVANGFLIESALRAEIGEGLADVESIPQLWSWVNTSLVPKLFVQVDDLGLPLAAKTDWSRVLMYNRLQGPVLFQQTRSDRRQCGGGSGIVGSMVCYPMETANKLGFGRSVNISIADPRPGEYAGGTVTRAQRQQYYASAFVARAGGSSGAGRRLRTLAPWLEGRPSGDSTMQDSVFQAMIYPNTEYASVQEHINYLYRRGWLDSQSKQLDIKALLLNTDVQGRPRLEQVAISIFFSRGGGIFVKLRLQSLFMKFWADVLSVLFDVLWMVNLLIISAKESFKLARACLNRSWRKNCFRFWTVLEWSIILLGWLCVVGFGLQEMMRRQVLERMVSVIDAQKRDVPAEHNQLGGDLHHDAIKALSIDSWLWTLVAFYDLLLLMRFFIAFRAQPRLGVVTGTLEASLVDIIHFMIVLLPTFMAYAISSCFIFGRRLEEYSGFDSAIAMCFKMLMESQYEWDILKQENWWTAAFWMWSFMVLMVLIMLNMVLAIVMDIYTEVRTRTGNSETVWMTIIQLVRYIRHRRAWISEEEINETLNDMGRLITKEELMKEFPLMCNAQLDSLLTACASSSEVSGKSSMKDTIKMQNAVKVQLDKVAAEIMSLNNMGSTRDNSLTPMKRSRGRSSNKDRSWLEVLSERMAVQNHSMLSIQWQLQQLQWQWAAVNAVCGKDLPQAESQATSKLSRGASQEKVL